MMVMETIESGLAKHHRPGTKSPFADAVYELFREFRDVYAREEWPRLDDCERMYQGDHWHDVEMKNPREPRPTTPILFSTIENVRADLADEYPEAIIRPEDASDEVLAKVLTAVVRQNLEASDYDREYDALTHDLLVGGWMAQEVGWDPSMNGGAGGCFLRHVSNKNILFDPYCVDLQDGRAVFKFDRLPKEWFRQHYPTMYPHLQGDEATLNQGHGEFENTIRPGDMDYHILIEAWFRFFDAETGRFAVHMVKLAGGCVLENSCDVKPEGYFLHGMYPFVVTPLFEQKGTALGLGIVDMFKNAQQYSDKIDQIILKNALTAGHNRFLVMEDSVDVEDLKDFSKEVITTTAPPNSVMSWMQDRPLPPHIVGYMQQMRASIKEESGTNDFSRGNVASGVTAASAIAALQEMSSKRSRMEARRIHYGFKQAVRMMLEVVREFDIFPRQVVITMGGEPQAVMVSSELYRALDGGELMPIEFAVSIQPARATRFARISNNQMILEFCGMFGGQMDPAMLMEAMDFDGQELILEKLRAAQGMGMEGLKREMAQMEEALRGMSGELKQVEGENEELKRALLAAQLAIGAGMPPMERGMPGMVQETLPMEGDMPGMMQETLPMEGDMPGMMAEMPPMEGDMPGMTQETLPMEGDMPRMMQEMLPVEGEGLGGMPPQELPAELLAMLGGSMGDAGLEYAALPPKAAEKAEVKKGIAALLEKLRRSRE